MAGEPWNRVNINFPGAVSSVRIPFSSNTDTVVQGLLVENENVLKILRSEILQTEVRVLYELLYILNNSLRGNKTYKGLKQVEQCINRLKIMKLDVALGDLRDLCPSRVQRGLGIKTGECDVPSQPMLEWLGLKVLGAAQLMSCTLDRCSTAFTLSKQQMKWEEFVILNMVITSLLSRLWVIFRGVLVHLSSMYQRLLVFLREVAKAKPMPYLTDYTLPTDMAQLLGPSCAFVFKRLKAKCHAVGVKETQQQRQKSSIQVKKQRKTRKASDDLGVAVERGIVHDRDMKPFLEIFSDFPEAKSLARGTYTTNKKQRFKKQLREATSFVDMAAHLEEMITWCKSQRMKKERCFLTFLRLKCHKMICLEEAGYSVQRKLQSLRQEAVWASSAQGSAPRTCRSSATLWRNIRLRKRFHTLRSRFRFSKVKNGLKDKHLKRRKRRRELSEESHRGFTTPKPTIQTPGSDDHDDIDDIFSSVGL